MKTLVAVGILAAAVAAAGDKAAKPEAITLNAADLKFGPAPAALPAGAQLAVLYGDPGKKDPFAIRLKMPDGYKVPAHWHTNDEQLTVMAGTFMLSMGDKFDAATAHSLAVGSFHFLPGKAHHAAEAKGETIVEIHGMGPFDIHYLNPADDPSKKAASKSPAP